MAFYIEGRSLGCDVGQGFPPTLQMRRAWHAAFTGLAQFRSCSFSFLRVVREERIFMADKSLDKTVLCATKGGYLLAQQGF